MRLDWRRHATRPGVWIADGVYDGQWYAVRRDEAKYWVAIFHDREGPYDTAQWIGRGKFNEVKRCCRLHAADCEEQG